MSWSRESRQARGYGAAWAKLRVQVFRRDCGLCQACARKGKVAPGSECHHRKPKAQGGTDSMDNLETLCAACHLAADAAAQGKAFRPKVRIGLDGYAIKSAG